MGELGADTIRCEGASDLELGEEGYAGAGKKKNAIARIR